MKRDRKRQLLRRILGTCLAGCFAVLFLLPTVLTVTNSFLSASEIAANYGSVFATTETGGKVFVSRTVNLKFIPDMVSFSQYFTVLIRSPEYLLKYWNSLLYVVPIVAGQLFVATAAAYGFSRLKGRARRALFFLYLVLMLMPYQVTLVPNFLVLRWLHLVDTPLAIWLPGIFSPFAVYLLTKYMSRIPAGTIEAARMDGASEWVIFTRICLPLCRGAVVAVGIMLFVDYWNMVEQPLLLLADEEMHPLSVFLSKINAGEISLAFAVAVLYMVPPLLLYLYGEDDLVEGISFQGSVKT